jgi:hypothetical protein
LVGFCDIERDGFYWAVECWDGLDDPRIGNAALHDFHEILAIAMCAVLCGGQGSVDMGLFAKAKEPFLRGFLKLENGVPSRDTFSRLFLVLDPEQTPAVRIAVAEPLPVFEPVGSSTEASVDSIIASRSRKAFSTRFASAVVSVFLAGRFL